VPSRRSTRVNVVAASSGANKAPVVTITSPSSADRSAEPSRRAATGRSCAWGATEIVALLWREEEVQGRSMLLAGAA
jgi:hypothetical protein